MSDLIYPGQRVVVEMHVRLAGVPTDPLVMRCLVRTPDGSQNTLTYPDENLTKRDTGFFEANVLLDTPGAWSFRSEAIGIVDGVDEITVAVSDSVFT